jgi:hypothetical protein
VASRSACALLTLGLFITACSLGANWEELSRGAAATAQPGGGDAGADPSTEAGAGADAGAEAETGAKVVAPASKCTKAGDRVTGTPYDASPTPETSNALACNVENVLAEDGLVAGLDRKKVGSTPKIDNDTINGCVGVELAELTALAKIVVRVAASPDACGASVCEQTSDGCGTGRSVEVFGGPSRESLERLDRIETEPTMKDYEIDVVTPLKVIVVCRNAWGYERDDAVVDAIYGVCR